MLSFPQAPSAPALYSGGLDKDGKPYIARLYWSITFKVRSSPYTCSA